MFFGQNEEDFQVFIAVGMRARAAGLLGVVAKGTGTPQEMLGVADGTFRKPDRFDCFWDGWGKEEIVTRLLPLNFPPEKSYSIWKIFLLNRYKERGRGFVLENPRSPAAAAHHSRIAQVFCSPTLQSLHAFPGYFAAPHCPSLRGFPGYLADCCCSLFLLPTLVAAFASWWHTWLQVGWCVHVLPTMLSLAVQLGEVLTGSALEWGVGGKQGPYSWLLLYFQGDRLQGACWVLREWEPFNQRGCGITEHRITGTGILACSPGFQK